MLCIYINFFTFKLLFPNEKYVMITIQLQVCITDAKNTFMNRK